MPKKRNAGAKIDGFTAVPKHPPGRNSWRCIGCSKNDQFKSATPPGKWNGAMSTHCSICSKPATPACVRFGTNGKDGGKWAPWVADDSKPKVAPAVTSPSQRSAEQKAFNEKRRADNLAKDLADTKKKLAAAKASPAADDADADEADADGGDSDFTTRKARVDALVEEVRDYKGFYAKYPTPDHANTLAEKEKVLEGARKELAAARSPDDRRKHLVDKLHRFLQQQDKSMAKMREYIDEVDRIEQLRVDEKEKYEERDAKIVQTRLDIEELRKVTDPSCQTLPAPNSPAGVHVAVDSLQKAMRDTLAANPGAPPGMATMLEQIASQFSILLQNIQLQATPTSQEQKQQQQHHPQQQQQQQHMQPDAAATTAAGNALVQQHQQALQQQQQQQHAEGQGGAPAAAEDARRVEQEALNDRQAFAVTGQLAASRPTGVPEPDLAAARPCPFVAPAADGSEVASVSKSGVVWTEDDMRRQFGTRPPPIAEQLDPRSPDRAAGNGAEERDKTPRRGKKAAEMSNDEVLNRPSKSTKQSETKDMDH